MTIISLFIEFINKCLSIKVMGIELIDYLLGFAIIIMVFKIISIVGGSHTSTKQKKKESK